MTQHYFLGIDGGGSKTLGVIMDQSGAILANARMGASAVVGIPSVRACEVLATMKQRLCDDAGIAPDEITGVGLGLNGIDFVDEYPAQFEALSACLGIAHAHFTLVNDGIVALWGASPARASVIVHHGSGVTNAFRADYGQERLFDHLDAGKMFEIRHALAAVVARMIDGREERTPLLAAMLDHYGVHDEGAYAELLFRGRISGERILTGPGIAFTAWQLGDLVAMRLIERAANDYACAARALVRHTGDDACRIAFGGGVLNHAPDAFIALIAERISMEFPRAGVLRPMLSPAHGAALMTAFHHGIDSTVLYARLLDAGSVKGS